MSQSPSLSSFRSISSHPSGFEYRGNFPPSKLGLWPSLLILVLIFDEINHAWCGKNGERRCNSFIVIQARENYRLLCFHCNLVPRISEVFLHSNLRWRMNRFVLWKVVVLVGKRLFSAFTLLLFSVLYKFCTSVLSYRCKRSQRSPMSASVFPGWWNFRDACQSCYSTHG